MTIVDSPRQVVYASFSEGEGEKTMKSILVTLTMGALATAALAGCASSISQARKSEARRDFGDAMYMYATAVADGYIGKDEFTTKMMQLHQDLGSSFCFYLGQALDRNRNKTEGMAKKGKTGKASLEITIGANLAFAKERYCKPEEKKEEKDEASESAD
jgi:hypothetical protein